MGGPLEKCKKYSGWKHGNKNSGWKKDKKHFGWKKDTKVTARKIAREIVGF